MVINAATRSWTISVSLPIQGWLAVGGVVLLGTALAFPLIMQGLPEEWKDLHMDKWDVENEE